MRPCADPECEYPANSDPSISDGYCCEKCEGRANGEEWASQGKKKHTAYCSSKAEGFDEDGGGGGGEWGAAPAWAGGFGKAGASSHIPGKCANPECEYMKHSDPSISRKYCCEKCEGIHQGADWAEGGKKHYKHCEKIEAGTGGGSGSGYGGGSGSGYGYGAVKGGWNGGIAPHRGYGPAKGDKYGGQKGTWVMVDPYGAPYGMKGYGKGKADGDAKGKGGYAKGKADGDAKGKGGKAKDAKGGAKGGKKGASLKDHASDCKVWVGNLPEGVELEALKEHFSLAGGKVKFAAMMKGNTGGVAYETAEEAQTAITVLNFSDVGGQAIQVDSWSSGPASKDGLS